MSDMISLSKFKEKLKDVSRTNRVWTHFDLLDDMPFISVDGTITEDAPYFVTTTTLPGETNTPIEVNFAGNVIKLAGGTTEPGAWTCDFVNDINFKAYKMIQSWLTLKHDVKTGYVGVASAYERDLFISWLDNKGVPIATMMLKDASPDELGEMSYDTATGDAQTYSTTWNYAYRIVTFGPDSLSEIQDLARKAAEGSIEIVADTLTNPITKG